MARTCKITMTVFCLEQDAEDAKESLEEWFENNNLPLSHIKLRISEPTPEENEMVREALDEDELTMAGYAVRESPDA